LIAAKESEHAPEIAVKLIDLGIDVSIKDKVGPIDKE
jgi:hypothetical protein